MALQVPPACDLTLGLVCTDKTTPGRTVWTMTADERFSNPAGIMQGGFLSACADSAMGASAVTSLEGRRASVSNAEMKMTFLRPVTTGSRLTCTATVLTAGRSVIFVAASIVDDAGREVARASSSYVVRERNH